ncbi:hypothetical protein E1294_07735 [Nonomuraea diastatica]|uniref:Protein kinase domain-containing protein n=2 Tax=Nonomuraea diastatica TaxID=1848329 RepID=A0A4R4X192_9ACTN|nr:hypothetical protein E1294_07735 [Nonomuraea diastatica]
MGIVYAGVDSAGRRAAIKLIHDMHATNQEFRVRFRREVAMLRRVQGTCCGRMLAEALVAIHAAGVVRRDLKPSSVMISPQGPRLVDFGIARSLDGTSLTASGVRHPPGVLHSTEMSRKGRTCSGVLPTARTSGRLRMLLGGRQEGSPDDNSYLEYKLTIDTNNRPAKFVLTWSVPVEGSGSYDSVFTTTYRGWKETGEISKP